MAAQSRRLTMAQAISEAIGHEMSVDPNVFVMGEDVGSYGGILSSLGRLPYAPQWRL